VLSGHHGPVSSVAFSPDGQHIASGSNDGTVRIWNVDGQGTPVVLSPQPARRVWSLAFSPDGQQLAVGSADVDLQIWPSTGHGQPLPLHGHHGPVWALAFSPDGQRIASSSGDDGGIRLWQTTNGHEEVEYHGFDTTVESIAFHPDNRHLITAHADGTVRIWRCEACDPITQVRTRAATRLTTGNNDTPDLLTAPND